MNEAYELPEQKRNEPSTELAKYYEMPCSPGSPRQASTMDLPLVPQDDREKDLPSIPLTHVVKSLDDDPYEDMTYEPIPGNQ